MIVPIRLPVGALALVLAVCLGQCGAARADIITDATGDFIPTYTGSKTGAFDVISAGGTFDGVRYNLFATLAAPVASAPAGTSPLYVWGINTGTGPNNFANVGNPNVRFNNVFTLNAAGATNNPAVTGLISGDMVSISVPLSLLPSTGFDPRDYLWNLWPRDLSSPAAPAPVGGAAAISDFAPDNATARFTAIGGAVPEPGTLAVFGLLAAGGVVAHRKRRPG